MPKILLSDQLITAIKSLGGVEVESKSRKYRTFSAGGWLYFVGKNGALRKGKTVSGSVSVPKLRKALLEGK